MAIKNLGRVTGKSAYEIWLEQGNTGTEEDFLNSLKAGGTGGSCLLTEVIITIDENEGEETTVPVIGLELDYTSVELEVGQGMQLACSVLPSNATNNAITWSSSDSTKVKVEEGYITALASGNATITAKSVENSSIKASCLVTVPSTSEGGDEGETTIDVTNITLDKTSLSLKVDETETLKATVLPSDATNKNVVWSSSDNSKATVSNGVVTALAEGNVTITARSQSNTSITATCSVTIETKETGGETTDKIMFASLTPVKTDANIKADGKTEDLSTSGEAYYKLPYSEGMYISTCTRASWILSVPPVVVIDNDVVTIPQPTDKGYISSLLNNYTVTLNGFSNKATIYANVADGDSVTSELCYYIPGTELGGDSGDNGDSGNNGDDEELNIVPLYTVENLSPYMIKMNKTQDTDSGAWSVEVPYHEGMTVHGCFNESWKTIYPACVVNTNGTYTVVESTSFSEEWINSAAVQTTATLTGYDTNSTVIINIWLQNDDTEEKAKAKIESLAEWLYYSYKN